MSPPFDSLDLESCRLCLSLVLFPLAVRFQLLLPCHTISSCLMLPKMGRRNQFPLLGELHFSSRQNSVLEAFNLVFLLLMRCSRKSTSLQVWRSGVLVLYLPPARNDTLSKALPLSGSLSPHLGNEEIGLSRHSSSSRKILL